MWLIKSTIILCPIGIYRRAPVEAACYITGADSRWAVVKVSPRGDWDLFHRSSGMSVSSLLPYAGRTRDYVVSVVHGIEADKSLDLSAFDALPKVTMATTKAITFSDEIKPTPEVITALRTIAINMRPK